MIAQLKRVTMLNIIKSHKSSPRNTLRCNSVSSSSSYIGVMVYILALLTYTEGAASSGKSVSSRTIGTMAKAVLGSSLNGTVVNLAGRFAVFDLSIGLLVLELLSLQFPIFWLREEMRQSGGRAKKTQRITACPKVKCHDLWPWTLNLCW